MAGGGARSGPASTLQHPDPALCLYRTIFCVTSILISSGYDCASVPPHSIFQPIFVLTSWYRNPQRFYTREEVAKLAMAAANLLVSCPLDFKVGTFSMKYKFTILFLCGDSARYRACFSCIKLSWSSSYRYIVYSGFVAEAKR